MPASRICGFETGASGEVSGGGVSPAGTFSFPSSGQRTGSYCLRVNPTGTNTGMAPVRVITASLSSMWSGFAFKPVSFPASDEIFAAVWDLGAPPARKLELRITSTGQIRVINSAGTDLGATSVVFTANQWHYVEIRSSSGAAATAYDVRVNGTSVASGTTAQLSGAAHSLRLGKVTDVNGNSVDFYYDDVYLDGFGFLGSTTQSPKVYQLLPNAAGTYAGWTNGTGTTFSEVDEVPPESDGTDASYIQASATQDNQKHTFNFQSKADVGAAGSIDAVQQFLWAKTASTSGTSTVQQLVISGGVEATTTGFEMTTAYVAYMSCRSVDPNGNVAWTDAALNAFEAGMQAGSIAQTQRFSTVYLHFLVLTTTSTTETRTVTPVAINLNERRLVGPVAINLQKIGVTRTVTAAINVAYPSTTIRTVSSASALGTDVTGQSRVVFDDTVIWNFDYNVTGGGGAATGPRARKSSDIGVNWTSGIDSANRFGDAPGDGATTGYSAWGCWYDKWSPNHTGTRVHFAIAKQDGNGSNDQFIYGYFDIDSETYSTPVTINTGTTSTSLDLIAITRARSGRLYALHNSEAWYSDDEGANWTSITALSGLGLGDRIEAFPANTGDDDDICVIVSDQSAGTVAIRMYDASANSWTTTNIATGLTISTTHPMGSFGAAVRHSDGHLFVAVATAVDVGTADLLTYDVTPDSIASPTITQKTNVITDRDDWYYPDVFINQQNDELFITHIGDSDGLDTFESTVGIFRRRSTDGGTTWGAQQIVHDTTLDDYRWVHAGHSVGNEGGYHLPIWFDDDDSDLLCDDFWAVRIAPIVPPDPRLVPASVNLLAIATARTVSNAKINLQQLAIARTVTAALNLQETKARTVTSATNLQKTEAKTVPAALNLLSTPTRTVTAAANLLSTQARTATAAANLLSTQARTTPSAFNLTLGSPTRTVTGVAVNLSATAARTVPEALNLVVAGIARAVPASVNLSQQLSRTVTGAVNLSATVTRTVTPASLNLQALGLTRTVTDSLNLVQLLTRTVTTTRVNLRQTLDRTVASGFNLVAAPTRSVPAQVDLRKTLSRTAPAAVNLQRTLDRTVTGSANLKATEARTVTVSIDLVGTAPSVTIPAKINLLQLAVPLTVTNAGVNLQRLALVRTATAALNLQKLAIARTVIAKVNLVQPGITRTVTAALNLRGTGARTAPAALNLQQRLTRTVSPAALNLKSTRSRTVTGSLNLRDVETRTAPAAVNLAEVFVRTAPAAVNLSRVLSLPVPAGINLHAVEAVEVPVAIALVWTQERTVTGVAFNLIENRFTRHLAPVAINLNPAYRPGMHWPPRPSTTLWGIHERHLTETPDRD